MKVFSVVPIVVVEHESFNEVLNCGNIICDIYIIVCH